MKIVIINYGMGNLRSIQKKLDWDGKSTLISDDLGIIEKAEKLILPGVGHFSAAMQCLKDSQLCELLNHRVLEDKVPVLGICLGMQLMAKHSEEGNCEGLGWFDAKVVKFDIKDKLKYKIPHMGWNNILIKKTSPLMEGISEDQKFYFVHSYHWMTDSTESILSETDYEYPFVSAINRDNIYGVQFHPEKSHEQGERLLKNFYKL